MLFTWQSCVLTITGSPVEGWYGSHFPPLIHAAISVALSHPLKYAPCMKLYHSPCVPSPAKNNFFTRPAMFAKTDASVPITGSVQDPKVNWFCDHLLTKISSKRRNKSHYFSISLRQNSENKPRGFHSSKALFERLIFGGAYLWREIRVSKSIGLAL